MSAPPISPAILLASDHAGLPLKEHLARHLRESGRAVEDLGTHAAASVDYPDYAHALARALTERGEGLGVLVCGSGVGISIAANRHQGVRAVVCSESYSATMARRHNDANVLCLGARVVGPDLATHILEAFLAAEFEGGRHARRVAKIEIDADPGR